MTQKNFARRYIEKIFLFGLHIYFTPPILLLKKVFLFFWVFCGGRYVWSSLLVQKEI